MYGDDAHLEQMYEDRYTTLADYDAEEEYDEDDIEEECDEEDEEDGIEPENLAPARYTGRHRAGIL